MRRLLFALLAIAVAVAACGSGAASPTPPPTATPSPAPTPTPTAPAVTTPTESPSATQTPVSTSAPTAVLTPLPTGPAGALAFVHTYEDALLAGNYAMAWSMLGHVQQLMLGSLDGFETERQAFLETAGKAYTALANPPTPCPSPTG